MSYSSLCQPRRTATILDTRPSHSSKLRADGAFLALELNRDAAVPLVVVVTSRTSADDKRLQPRSFCGMPQSIWALCLRNLIMSSIFSSKPKVKSKYLNCCFRSATTTEQARMAAQKLLHSLELQLRATALVVRTCLYVPVAPGAACPRRSSPVFDLDLHLSRNSNG